MKHLGLFEGIGGFSLAARWMGWDTIAWCEINPFCQQVLKHHFPNATPHTDIITTDFTVYRGMVDILTGGFPCQPYSTAGKRLGKEDERHLWPHMLRAIREVQPRWVVGENVRGLTNWNGGLVFDEVQADLEAEGFEVTPFLLPACAVDAPHRRDRIWFIAYADQKRRGEAREGSLARRHEWAGGACEQPTASHSNGRNKSRNGVRLTIGEVFTPRSSGRARRSAWERFPTQSPVCPGNDGLPSRLDLAAFHRWRSASLSAAGNAVVPQLPYMIYQAIAQYESQP